MATTETLGRAYHAAELFHLPAKFFNDALVARLEDAGLSVFSPQRDGFEFSLLHTVLSAHLPTHEAENILNVVIYAYDIKSLWESDVVVARFDEPPDPGVDTEVLFAHAAGIPVVVYRTDVRSPYGSHGDRFGGMHSFPIKEAPVLILSAPSGSVRSDMDHLVENIVDEVEYVLQMNARKTHEIPVAYQHVFDIISVLFDGIDVHSQSGIVELVRRYNDHKSLINSFGPRVVR